MSSSFGELEELFEHLINDSPMGIFVYALMENDRLVLRGANRTSCKMLGLDCVQLVGKTIEEAFPALAATDIPDHYRRLAREGGSWDREHVEYRDDRFRGIYDIRAFQTTPNRMAVMFLDVTESAHAIRDLANARAQLEASIEAMEAGVVIADSADLRIKLVNTGAMTIRGVAAGDLAGRTVSEFISRWQILHLDGMPYRGSQLPLSRAISTGEVVHNEEMVITHRDGGKRYVIANAAPVRDEVGCISGGVMVFMDVTENKKAQLKHSKLERQMQQAQKLESLGVLAGGIAHDFNNLLCVMLGGADLALAELSPPHPSIEGIEMIRETAQRATDLCRQTLAYSGQGDFQFQPLNLTELLHGMENLLRASISKKAALEFGLAEELPTISGDATQLRQIILNLVVNSSDALGDKGGMISIRAGVMQCDEDYLVGTYLQEDLSPGNYVFLEVSDTGCGMDKRTKQHLFDPFYTTKKTGRGLGLAAVLGIVRGHSGTMKVYSEFGCGSTFKVLFPASEEAQPPATATVTVGDWQGKGRVLVVDDEEAVRRVGAMMLERLGFEVVTACDGVEGVKTYIEDQANIDLVILDMTMPNMDGEEAFNELRRINPDVKVVLTSGYNAADATERFCGKGLSAFIQKPFLLKDVRKCLSEIMA